MRLTGHVPRKAALAAPLRPWLGWNLPRRVPQRASFPGRRPAYADERVCSHSRNTAFMRVCHPSPDRQRERRPAHRDQNEQRPVPWCRCPWGDHGHCDRPRRQRAALFASPDGHLRPCHPRQNFFRNGDGTHRRKHVLTAHCIRFQARHRTPHVPCHLHGGN